MKATHDRIEIIDAFRGLAIILVVIYHFYFAFSPPRSAINYLPYQYPPTLLSEYGNYGVQLFFVISGFVISQTLLRSNNFKEFLLKRLIRLFPTLLLCVVITYLVQETVPHNIDFIISKTPFDFLPSLTFTPPLLWNFLLPTQDIKYVDGVYWTLFVEMGFYLVGGIVFFLRPKSFSVNWLRIVLILVIVRVIASPKLRDVLPSFGPLLDYVYESYLILHLSYWVYFALGVFFYELYRKEIVSKEKLSIIMTLALFELYFLQNLTLRFFFCGLIILFLVFVYRDHWIRFLANRWFLWIGTISYPLYLLHENIGLVLMNIMSRDMNNLSLKKQLPILAFLILVGISSLVYLFFEKPAMNFLKRQITSKISQKKATSRSLVAEH